MTRPRFSALRLWRAGGIVLRRALRRRLTGARRSLAAAARKLAWPLAAVTGTIGIVLLLLMQLSAAVSSKAAGQTRDASPFHAEAGEPADEEWRDGTHVADRGRPWWLDRDHRSGLEPAAASFLEDERPVPVPEPELPPPWSSDSELAPPRPQPHVSDVDLELAVAHYADRDERFAVASEDLWSDTPPAPLGRGRHTATGPGLPHDDPWSPFDRQRAEASRPPLAESALLAAFADSRGQPPLEPVELETAPEGLTRFDVSIEKHVPARSVVFEPLDYEIVLRNTGDDEIPQVNVDELVPQSQRVQQTIPAARVAGQNISWQLRDIGPGEIRKLHVRTVPTAAGIDESAALVEATAAIMATTRVTLPRLRLEVLPPERCTVGRLATLTFRVTNEGEVDAEDVLLRTDLPATFTHPLGRELDYPLGTLAPGETRETTLMARAETTGTHTHWSDLQSEGQRLDVTEYALPVEPPALSLRREGVKQPAVGEAVEFVNHLFNTGDRDLAGLEVLETVPDGFEIVSIANGGQVDRERRLVRWQIDELAAGRRITLGVTLRARQPATLQSVVTVHGDALDEETMQATITARTAVPPPARHPAAPRMPGAAPWPQAPYRQAWPFGGGLRSGCVP